MNNRVILFVTLVTSTPNKLQYTHSPEIFVLIFPCVFLPSNSAKNVRTWEVKNAADMRAFFQP